jgi:hypothetical protein
MSFIDDVIEVLEKQIPESLRPIEAPPTPEPIKTDDVKGQQSK